MGLRSPHWASALVPLLGIPIVPGAPPCSPHWVSRPLHCPPHDYGPLPITGPHHWTWASAPHWVHGPLPNTWPLGLRPSLDSLSSMGLRPSLDSLSSMGREHWDSLSSLGRHQSLGLRPSLGLVIPQALADFFQPSTQSLIRPDGPHTGSFVSPDTQPRPLVCSPCNRVRVLSLIHK